VLGRATTPDTNDYDDDDDDIPLMVEGTETPSTYIETQPLQHRSRYRLLQEIIGHLPACPAQIPATSAPAHNLYNIMPICTYMSALCKQFIIIINPCKPYLSASATAPHPLGRRKAD
jgi:hypothetical protein